MRFRVARHPVLRDEGELPPGRTLPLLQSPGVEIRAAAANRSKGDPGALPVGGASAVTQPWRSGSPAGFALVQVGPRPVPGSCGRRSRGQSSSLCWSVRSSDRCRRGDVVVGTTWQIDRGRVVVDDVVGVVAGSSARVVVVVGRSSVQLRSTLGSRRVRRRRDERGGRAGPAFCRPSRPPPVARATCSPSLLSDVSVETASCRPLLEASRWTSMPWPPPHFAAVAVNRSDPTILEYWSRVTP